MPYTYNNKVSELEFKDYISSSFARPETLQEINLKEEAIVATANERMKRLNYYGNDKFVERYTGNNYCAIAFIKDGESGPDFAVGESENKGKRSPDLHSERQAVKNLLLKIGVTDEDILNNCKEIEYAEIVKNELSKKGIEKIVIFSERAPCPDDDGCDKYLQELGFKDNQVFYAVKNRNPKNARKELADFYNFSLEELKKRYPRQNNTNQNMSVNQPAEVSRNNNNNNNFAEENKRTIKKSTNIKNNQNKQPNTPPNSDYSSKKKYTNTNNLQGNILNNSNITNIAEEKDLPEKRKHEEDSGNQSDDPNNKKLKSSEDNTNLAEGNEDLSDKSISWLSPSPPPETSNNNLANKNTNIDSTVNKNYPKKRKHGGESVNQLEYEPLPPGLDTRDNEDSDNSSYSDRAIKGSEKSYSISEDSDNREDNTNPNMQVNQPAEVSRTNNNNNINSIVMENESVREKPTNINNHRIESIAILPPDLLDSDANRGRNNKSTKAIYDSSHKRISHNKPVDPILSILQRTKQHTNTNKNNENDNRTDNSSESNNSLSPR